MQKGSLHRRRDPCEGNEVVSASVKDGDDLRIDTAQLAGPSAVGQSAVDVVGLWESLQDRGAAAHTVPSAAGTGIMKDSSCLLGYIVQKGDELPRVFAPSSWEEHLPSVVGQKAGPRRWLTFVLMLREVGSSRPSVHGRHA